jgi:uncharacterized repeat protein (TIGR03943 family)
VASAIRAVVLFGLAGLIGRLLLTGEMVKYMSPALDPLTALAGVVAACMGLFELRQAVRHLRPDGEPDSEELHGHGEEPGHWSDQLVTAGVILVPVLVGLLLTPRALGVGALGGEPINGLLVSLAPGSAAVPPPARPVGTPPIEDVQGLIDALRTQGDGALGQRIRASGVAAPGSDLADDELALLRFTIAHCVADARPLALLVVTPEARQVPGGAGALDQWVQVEGLLTTRERDGVRLVTIEADRVERVGEPANPYIRSAF